MPYADAPKDVQIDWPASGAAALGIIVAYVDGNADAELELLEPGDVSVTDRVAGVAKGFLVWTEGQAPELERVEGEVSLGFTLLLVQGCIPGVGSRLECDLENFRIETQSDGELFELKLRAGETLSAVLCTADGIDIAPPAEFGPAVVRCAADGRSYEESGLCGRRARSWPTPDPAPEDWPCSNAGLQSESVSLHNPRTAVLQEGLSSPKGLSVDDTHVYWTEVGFLGVKRCPLAGGEPEAVLDLQRDVPKMPVALQPERLWHFGEWIYWADSNKAALGRFRPAPLEHQFLVTPPQNATIQSIAVDLEAGELFIAGKELFKIAQSTASANPGSVQKTKLADTIAVAGDVVLAPMALLWRAPNGVVQAVARDPATGLFGGGAKTGPAPVGQLPALGGGLMGAADGWVYAMITPPDLLGHAEVIRGQVVQPAAGKEIPYEVLADHQGSPDSLYVSPEGLVWFHSRDGSVRSANLDGRNQQVLYRGPSLGPVRMAARDGWVYWLDSSQGTLARTPMP
jgi:hypothetical protein